MRVIDRIFTVSSGPRSARRDSRPRARTAEFVVGGSAVDDTASAPTNSRRYGNPVCRRGWSRAALTVELAVLALVTSASVAHADTVVVALADSLTTVLDNVRNWIMGILAGLATVFLSVGGVRYVMGSGDPGEVEKAKSAFKSAGWGYGLAALAPLIVEILKGIVGA